MINQELFDRKINGNLPVLANFYDDQDAMYRTMHTLLKIVEYHLEGKIKIAHIDINNNNNRTIVDLYLQKQVPTFVLFWKGKIKWSKTGFLTSRRLTKILKAQLKKLESKKKSHTID